MKMEIIKTCSRDLDKQNAKRNEERENWEPQQQQQQQQPIGTLAEPVGSTTISAPATTTKRWSRGRERERERNEQKINEK